MPTEVSVSERGGLAIKLLLPLIRLWLGAQACTASLSMAALGYRHGSVRFPLASRNVCPNNGIEAGGKFHFGGERQVSPHGPLDHLSPPPLFPPMDRIAGSDRCELWQIATYLKEKPHSPIDLAG